MLSFSANVEDAARLLSRYFETTIIKLGPDGCLLRENGQNEIFPATSGIDPIDATGAGDAFNAGFIYGLCSVISFASRICGLFTPLGMK